MVAPVIISGPEALADFRRGLTGERLLEQLEEAGGRLLVTLAVGVGKSEFMVKAIDHSLTRASDFDLVVVLLPRRDILNEIRRRLPPGSTPSSSTPARGAAAATETPAGSSWNPRGAASSPRRSSADPARAARVAHGPASSAGTGSRASP